MDLLESLTRALLERKSLATPSIINKAERFLNKEGYELKTTLGVGPSGAVILAQKTKKSKIFQMRIKVIVTSNDTERTSCLREVEFAMQVKSQFAAKIIEYFNDPQNSCIYVISEYLEGVCLNEFLQRNEKIEEKEIAVIVKGILKGVMALKQKQVIHGAIKPSNILITPNKSAVLVDYDVTWRILHRIKQEAVTGGCQSTESAGEYVKQQETLEIIDEDWLYQPMEQWKEGLAVTESDIYATGMILYYLCGGRDDAEMASMRQGIFPPFNENSNIKLLRLANWMMKVDPKMRALPDTIITKLSVLIAPLQERYTTINYKGGDSYYGQLLNGLKHGNGRYKKKNGTIYEGEWQNGMRNGYGKMFYNEGEEKGNRYEGDFQDDLKHGRGVYTFHNGRKYIGDFECDVFDGYGILYNPKKERYEGHFKQSKFNGQGKYFYKSKDVYQGTFFDGIPQGRGTLRYRNKDVYEGFFKAGLRHGRGIMRSRNGDVIEGEFVDNVINGYVEQFFTNGSMFFGRFQNNKREEGTLMKVKKGGSIDNRYTIQTGKWSYGYFCPTD